MHLKDRLEWILFLLYIKGISNMEVVGGRSNN